MTCILFFACISFPVKLNKVRFYIQRTVSENKLDFMFVFFRRW